MSMKVDMDLGCPECQTTFRATLFRSIWGEFPENRELVFSDKINVVSCPNCNFKSRMISSLLYVDMNRQFAVWYEPKPDVGVDKDTGIYAAMYGAASFYAKAPRIPDWGNFKRVITEYETGIRTASPIIAQHLKSPAELLTTLATHLKERPVDDKGHSLEQGHIAPEKTKTNPSVKTARVNTNTSEKFEHPKRQKHFEDYPVPIQMLFVVYGLGNSATFCYLTWTHFSCCAFDLVYNEIRALVWPIYWLVRLL
jgi:hypothetical protein